MFISLELAYRLRNSSYTLVEPALHSLYLKEKQFIVNELLVDS